MPNDDEETRHEIIPLEVDVDLVGRWDDIAAALEALGPTTGGYTARPQDRDKHPVQGWLRAWGWYGDLHEGRDGAQWLMLVGLYGDWSWFEDDEKLMPALAPFVRGEGRIIFQDPADWRYRNGDDIRAWVFKGGGVTLHDVDQEIVFYIND